MAHDRMYDPADPVLAWFRALALAFPGAKEKISHGRPVFFTTALFTQFSAIRKLEPSGMTQHPHAMLVKPDPLDVDLLLERDDAFYPAYVGASGWVGIELADLDDSAAKELLTESYRQTAPKKLVAQLP